MVKTQLNYGLLYQKRKWIILIKLIDFLITVFMIKNKSNLDKDSIKKVLVMKVDHIGDVLMTTSVFPVIKSILPEAKLDIVIGNWSKEIIDNNPYINQYFIYNHFRHNRSGQFITKLKNHIKTFFNTYQNLRKEKYDLCLILRAYGENGIVLSKLAGCSYIVGHGTGGFGPLLNKRVVWNEGVHETQHYIEVISSLFDKPFTEKILRPEIYYHKNDIRYVEEVLNQCHLQANKFIVIHPGTGNAVKMWRSKKWNEVARHLVTKGHKVIITGTSTETQLAQNIIKDNKDIIDLTGKFTIKQLAYILSLSNFILTVDTLAAHLGALSGKKTIVIYSGITNINQWVPLGDNVIVVNKSLSCSPCYKGSGCKEMACMQIEPDRVLKELEFSL